MKNLNKLMKQAQDMQTRMAVVQKELAETSFTGQAGGGLVSLTLSGAMDLRELKIDPEVLADADAEMLEDLITAAYRAAQESVSRASEEKLGPLAGGFGLPGI